MHVLKDTSILVSGGAGFIGSHLVKKLDALGAGRILVLDNFRYGDATNLGELSDRVQVIKFDLGTDPQEKLLEYLAGVDYVFHLAAEKHNQCKDSPYRYFRANVDGSFALFDAAARSGVKKVVYTSSLYAYGRMNTPVYREDEVPHPNTVYGSTKLMGEYLLDYFWKQHGLHGVVLRYLFIYGPRQFAGMGYKSVILKNFERILNNTEPIIFGDGLQELDYVFVDDTVDATVQAMCSKVHGEVFNVSTAVPSSVKHLVDTMLEVSKSKLRPEFGPADWTHGSSRVGCNRKIESMIGWKPTTSLHDGLAATYEWMKRQRMEKE